ncbi:hypothetical protein BDW71DRAFT_200833 [Aspergillus fruticulosus]
MGSSVAAGFQPNIIAEFVSFLLGTASTNLLWGRIYSLFNPKWVYVLWIAMFETGSTVCGAALNMNALIIGRALGGLGGGRMYLGMIMMLSLFTTPLQQPKDISIIGVVFGTVLLLSRNLQPGLTFWNRMKAVDWIGNILVIGVYVSGFMAISFRGTSFAWTSAQEIAIFCASGALRIALCVYQVWSDPKNRMFPVHFLKNWDLLQSDSLLAGVRLLPFTGYLAVFTMLNGHLVARSGYIMPWYVTPLVSRSSNGFIGMVLSGIGTGMFLNDIFAVAQSLAPRAGCHRFPTLDRAQIQSLTSGAASHPLEILSKSQQQKVLAEIVQAIIRVFILSIASGCFCLCLSVFMDRRKIKIG